MEVEKRILKLEWFCFTCFELSFEFYNKGMNKILLDSCTPLTAPCLLHPLSYFLKKPIVLGAVPYQTEEFLQLCKHEVCKNSFYNRFCLSSLHFRRFHFLCHSKMFL